jgi:hypothetical protein
MTEHEWIEFDGGSTLGQQGSERGTIIKDEECSQTARITLERDAEIAPHTITCGIYGWMVHTRCFGQAADADREYEQMKRALAAISSMIPDSPAEIEDTNQQNLIIDAIEKFVQTYP